VPQEYCRRSGPRRSRPWWEEMGVRVFRQGEVLHLVRYSRRGFPLDATTAYLGSDHFAAWLETVETGAEIVLQKPANRKVAGVASELPKDIRAAKEYPLLWDHLSQRKWDDGSPRQTSSMMLFEQDGVLKAMLRDKDAGLCLWVASKSLYGVLGALEAALGDPEAEWRVDRQAEGQQARRVKRGG
jgi:hypothetical protein